MRAIPDGLCRCQTHNGPETQRAEYPTCYPTCVNKTSVYLSAEEANRLALLARREGTLQAEIIRRAIKTYAPERRADRNFALVLQP